MEIIGHRGAAFDAPENTLASVRLAWEQGADAIECDVRLTKDARIVAIHDADTKRTAGVDRPVSDQPLDELRRLDVGRWKGEQFAGEPVPTLAELLATVLPGKRAFVEVKCGPEIAPELQRVLAASGLTPEQVAVIGFATDVLVTVKRLLPGTPAYWCVDLNAYQNGGWTIEDLVAAARSIGADGLDLSVTPAVTPALVRAAAAAGIPVYIWTVNDLTVAKQLIAAGVAGITTDRPGWLRKQLGR